MGESNARQPLCRRGALPTELIPQKNYGGAGGTRTRNPRLRRTVLYPVELQPHLQTYGADRGT